MYVEVSIILRALSNAHKSFWIDPKQPLSRHLAREIFGLICFVKNPMHKFSILADDTEIFATLLLSIQAK